MALSRAWAERSGKAFDYHLKDCRAKYVGTAPAKVEFIAAVRLFMISNLDLQVLKDQCDFMKREARELTEAYQSIDNCMAKVAPMEAFFPGDQWDEYMLHLAEMRMHLRAQAEEQIDDTVNFERNWQYEMNNVVYCILAFMNLV